ncbi:MAG: DEAD/DEAH box helicase, partial [Phycisphaerae bacterium]|nr:DEAD/DEAH box helicase [Gemmatimonadaceae bacterium]
RGRNVLTRVHLGSNEILQMAGRVHGRVEHGRVYILSDRDIKFETLRPTAPDFQLAGDSERVALTCADLGVRADELELPVPLDRAAYRSALSKLETRGLVENGRLTRYGRAVEALPVDRAWGELIVNGEDALLPALSVMSGIESLHRMTRDGRDLEGIVVRGSDHLTAYNLYAEAFTAAGYIGDVYGLQRHMFDAERVALWAERRGVLVKSLEDAALAMASVYRSVGLPLPTVLPLAKESTLRQFADLLARYMPFDLVIEEHTADGHEARVSKTSVAGSWGAVAGNLRYFADRFGVPRASIEGTQLSMELVKRNAQRAEAEMIIEPDRKHSPVMLQRRVTYYGFELSREVEPMFEFPPELAEKARHALAESLARGELRHPATRRNLPVVEDVRETYRRLGGITPRLGQAELTQWYETQMGDHTDWETIRSLPMRLDARDFITSEQWNTAREMPGAADIRDRAVTLEYDVEEPDSTPFGIVRIRLPEKLARTITQEEIPVLDRPIRFVVPRGQRGSVRANSLSELQDKLAMPYTDDELERPPRKTREEHESKRRELDTRKPTGEFRRHGKGPSRGGGKGGGRGGGKSGGGRRGR